MKKKESLNQLLVEIINDYRYYKGLYDPIALQVTLGKYHNQYDEKGNAIMPKTREGFLFHCCIDQTIYLDPTCKTKMIITSTSALEGLLVNYRISSGICLSCLEDHKTKHKIKKTVKNA